MTAPANRTLIRRASRGMVALLAAIAMVMAVTAPATAAAKKRSISLKFSTSSVMTGTKVTLSGKVTKSPKRSKIRIERYSAKKWRTVKTVRTTNRKGAFTYRFTTKGTGTTKYRAVALKTKKLKKATSKSRSLKVRAKPVTPKPIVPKPKVPTIKTIPALTGGTNGPSGYPVISADGNYTAYVSIASNLVTDTTNNLGDVYLTNNKTSATFRVSRTPLGNGGPNDGRSERPSISADGRYVAFLSRSMSMAAGGAGMDHFQVFLWDRLNPKDTIKISTNELGGGSDVEVGRPSISADGNTVVFSTWATNLVRGDTNERSDVFMWTRGSGLSKITQASGGGGTLGDSSDPKISGDGRYVTFTSTASNLTAGGSPTTSNVYVWDRTTPTVDPIMVSRAFDGSAPNAGSSAEAISTDGRYITFSSDASNIVSGDANDQTDVFVVDRTKPTAVAVHVSRDSTKDTVNGASQLSTISGDGRFVAYQRLEIEVIDGDTWYRTAVFVWDRTKPTTAATLVTRSKDGTPSRGDSGWCVSISQDGRYVAFDSDSSSLVDGDTNRTIDVFVWDRLGG